MNGLKMDEVRMQVKTIIANLGITMREAGRQIGCDASRLSKFLKGELNASPRVLKLIEDWIPNNRRIDTYGPIDEVLEHLEKAKMEIQAVKSALDGMAPFLVKKIGSIIEMRDWCLGRVTDGKH